MDQAKGVGDVGETAGFGGNVFSSIGCGGRGMSIIIVIISRNVLVTTQKNGGIFLKSIWRLFGTTILYLSRQAVGRLEGKT